MVWLVALMMVGVPLNRAEDERRLSEASRLLRGLGSEDLQPPPKSPSPHQLLGEVARPLVPLPRGRRSAASAFSSRRPG